MKTYAEKKAEVRDRAIEWQYEFADRVMTWGEVAEETAEFEAVINADEKVDFYRKLLKALE